MAHRPMKGTPNMATSTGTTSTRRWPRITVVFVVLFVAVAGVAVYFALRPSPAPVTAPPPPSLTPALTSLAPSATVSGAPTALADGCLGGTDPTKAILVAHDTAPLTPEGAAAFAATLMRWIGQVPQDPTQFSSLSDKIRAPSLPPQPLPSVPDGTTAWVSTTDARYRVTNVANADVTVEGIFEQTANQNGSTSTDFRPVRLDLTVINGHWALKGAGVPTQAPNDFVASMQATGLPYRGGC